MWSASDVTSSLSIFVAARMEPPGREGQMRRRAGTGDTHLGSDITSFLFTSSQHRNKKQLIVIYPPSVLLEEEKYDIIRKDCIQPFYPSN